MLSITDGLMKNTKLRLNASLRKCSKELWKDQYRKRNGQKLRQ